MIVKAFYWTEVRWKQATKNPLRAGLGIIYFWEDWTEGCGVDYAPSLFFSDVFLRILPLQTVRSENCDDLQHRVVSSLPLSIYLRLVLRWG
jgi:hypothetical protein